MKRIFFLISAIGVIYLFTISDTIFGGDSGDLVSAILTNGLAHPPGYPLYILLGLFVKFIPVSLLTTAGKVTLISTFSTIGSLFLLYLIIYEIACKKYFSKYLLLIILSVTGFNYLIWLYAVVPEVFPLNSLITLSIFYFAIKFYKSSANKYLYLLLLFIGLGISHHHTFVLVLPSIFYLLYQRKKHLNIKIKKALFLIFYLIIGLLPLLYSVYAGFKNAPVLWAKTNTVLGFFENLFRIKYGSFVAASSIQSTPQQRLAQFKALLTFIQDDFYLLGIIFFVFSVFFFFKLKKSASKDLLIATYISTLLLGPFFLFYANFPLLNAYYFATIERFMIVFYFFFSILIYFGLYFFINHIIMPVCSNCLKNPLLKKFTVYLTLTLLLSYPAGLFIQNFPIIYALKNDKTAENLGNDILNQIPNGSILFTFSDDVSFSTQYIYYGQKINKSKILIHLGKANFFNYLSNLQAQYPQLKTSKNKKISSFADIILEANRDSMNIYSENPIESNIKELEPYAWIQQGLLFKLVRKDKLDVDENINNIRSFWNNSLNKDLVNQVKQDNLKFKHFFTSDFLKIYSSSLENNALYLINNDLPDDGYKYIQIAIELDKYDPNINHPFFLSKYYVKKKNCKQAEAEIIKILKIGINKMYYDQALNVAKCYENEKDKKKIKEILNKYTLDKKIPLNKF